MNYMQDDALPSNSTAEQSSEHLSQQLAETDRVSIIVPAFNEAAVIGKVLDGITSSMSRYGTGYELIVVDDGSTDGTTDIVTAKGLRLIRHDFNRGYGTALKSGIRHSRHPFLAIIDSDGTYPVDMLPRLLAKMQDYDMIIGARTGEHVQMPLFRRPAKWFLKKLAHYLSGRNIPDLNSGLRVFRRELAERFFDILPEGFSFTTTITLAALTNDYRVAFVPINYYKRIGKSSIKPVPDFFGFLLLIVRLIVYFKPLRVFLPVSGVLLATGVTKAAIDFYYLSHFGVGAAIAILAALQTAFMGLLADLITRRPRW